jgi:hypothetical protein
MAERLVVEDGWVPMEGSYEEAVLSWHAQWDRVFSRRAAGADKERHAERRPEGRQTRPAGPPTTTR